MTSPHIPVPVEQREYLYPSEVAEIFGVSRAAVNRYVHDGKLHRIRTLGGHSRFDKAAIHRLADQLTVPVTDGAR